jgi:photosystem II stability/assembly factor-like uncharacterized protein
MRRLLQIVALILAVSRSGSAQWLIQDSHTSADLRGIHSIGNGIAWASGTNGTVLRTTDDGDHWQLCATPSGAEVLDFRGIQAFDANTAIVMSSGKGDLSRLYKTTDGCLTWKLVFTNPDKNGFWDALRFSKPWPKVLSKTDGVLIGDPVAGTFSVFLTSDSGETWRRWATAANASQKPRRTKLSLPLVTSPSSIFSQVTSFLSPGGDQGPAWCTRISTTSMARHVGPPSHPSGSLLLGLAHLPVHSP